MTGVPGAARVVILHVPDCPLLERLLVQTHECLTEIGVDARVELLEGEYPSPTLLVDGIDVATGKPPSGEPCCRLDLPTREKIRAAIAALG